MMKNKLWILRPIRDKEGLWKPWYDKAFGFIVCAQDVSEARKLASREHGDEGKDAWIKSEFSTCEELKPTEVSKVIMRDFASA
jgi:hypothetical protein